MEINCICSSNVKYAMQNKYKLISTTPKFVLLSFQFFFSSYIIEKIHVNNEAPTTSRKWSVLYKIIMFAM